MNQSVEKAQYTEVSIIEKKGIEHTWPILDALDKEILSSINSRNYFLATIGITTGIDILGRSHAELTKNSNGVGNRFIAYCDEFLTKHMSPLTSAEIYSLRNGLIHQFSPTDTRDQKNNKEPIKLALAYDNTKSRRTNDGVLVINIKHLHSAYIAAKLAFVSIHKGHRKISIDEIAGSLVVTDIDGSDASTNIVAKKR